MENYKHMVQCFICGSMFQFGPHAYKGKRINRYDFMVCSICYQGNWDGWNPGDEQKIIEHLNEKGLPVPKRNDKGWLPRE